MKSNLNKKISLFIFSYLVSFAANADIELLDRSSYYFGISSGNTSGFLALEENQYFVQEENWKIDDEDNYLKFFLGMRISSHLGFEFIIADLGKSSRAYKYTESVLIEDIHQLNYFVYEKTTSESTSYALNTILSYPITNDILAFAKIGAHVWEIKQKFKFEESISVPSLNYFENYVDSFSETDESINMYYAVGLDYRFSEFTVMFEFERYNFTTDDDDTHVNVLSLGIAYNF